MINKTGGLFPLLVIFSFLFCGIILAAEGNVVWTRTYNGAADDCDVGLGIAADGSGNVYVTGFECVTGGNTIFGYGRTEGRLVSILTLLERV